MDKIDLEGLERLAKEATPGPWCNDYEDIFKWMFMLTKKPIATAELPGNARYIVAACNAVPSLIARIRELEQELEVYHEEKQLEWERSRDE